MTVATGKPSLVIKHAYAVRAIAIVIVIHGLDRPVRPSALDWSKLSHPPALYVTQPFPWLWLSLAWHQATPHTERTD